MSDAATSCDAAPVQQQQQQPPVAVIDNVENTDSTKSDVSTTPAADVDVSTGVHQQTTADVNHDHLGQVYDCIYYRSAYRSRD